MNNKNVGMVYVATRKPHYVAEAFLSAHSARDFAPDLPPVVIDEKTCALSLLRSRTTRERHLLRRRRRDLRPALRDPRADRGG